ncbi:MAG TPA: hypothetical protein DCS48_12375 [Desulfovibrio sp.]|nr:hypothetical protein [Desulfovibrio sp.]
MNIFRTVSSAPYSPKNDGGLPYSHHHFPLPSVAWADGFFFFNFTQKSTVTELKFEYIQSQFQYVSCFPVCMTINMTLLVFHCCVIFVSENVVRCFGIYL